MKQVELGKTGIVVPQNGFGALPIQRVPKEEAVRLLRKAYSGGMRFFDTARAYSDSEEKLGEAFGTGFVKREEFIITTKTHAKTPEAFWKDLETSLRLLKTDYIDVYQLHNVQQCYKPGDGTGMYECLLEAKAQGMVRHIGATAHKLEVAKEIIKSGLYETLQYPYSYLSLDKETAMMKDYIEKEHNELSGDFCRGCGYCMPCTVGIKINNCNRMSLLLRRAPSEKWLSEEWQANMKQIEDCVYCGQCLSKCPYELNIPMLLHKNYEDYKKVLAGEISVS